jgi:Tfp pilus assembly protein PilN
MTLQQTPEIRPKKIDLNLLPSEYRPPKKSYLGTILFIVLLVLICATAFLIIMKLGVDDDIKSLKGELSSLQQQMVTLQANKDEAEPIKTQITAVRNQLATIEEDYQSFIDNRYAWSDIITEIDDLVPGKKITLNSISVTADNVIALAGTSTKRTYVYDFVVALEESDFFSNVDFSFGDCPTTDECDFNIEVPLTALNQIEGASNE